MKPGPKQPGRAVDQLGAQLLLELPDRFRKRRLGHVARVGGPGEGDVPLPRAGLLRYPEPVDQPGTSATESGIAAAGAAKAGAAAGDWPLAGVLAGRGIMPVSYAEWLRIETAETDLAKALGRGERVKLHNREAIWSACRPAREA